MHWSRRQVLTLAGVAAPAIVHAASLPDLITAVRTSVCAVGIFNALDSPRFTFRGTGFFVGDGSTVATCWHVIPDLNAINRPGVTTLAVQVEGANGAIEVRDAELLSSSRQHDLALLRMRGRPGQPVQLAATGSAREGMDVALLGFPIGGVLGYKVVTHRGIVAALVASALPGSTAGQLDAGAVSRLREGSFNLLQLDATAYPGNSGGPLFDVDSRQVIGVVNMVLVKNNRESALSQPTGITYAVPVQYLHELLAKP